MEKRAFGKTGHNSTIAIFGAVALAEVTQDTADRTMELVNSSGINHIDVAPGYGEAEVRLGPWMAKERDKFFLGCKTELRTREEAAAEIRRSLKRLQIEQFDLHQLHAVTSMEVLDQVTGKGGALKAIIEAHEEGLTRHIGITCHGMVAPDVALEALNRFEFDTVLFPINFILYANSAYRKSADHLLKICQERNVGTMIIKHIARGHWGDNPRTKTTWYEPFTEMEWIQKGVDFALSQPISGICTTGDVTVLPHVISACENFSPMGQTKQKELITQSDQFEAVFPYQG